jgi:hypothetical protein
LFNKEREREEGLGIGLQFDPLADSDWQGEVHVFKWGQCFHRGQCGSPLGGPGGVDILGRGVDRIFGWWLQICDQVKNSVKFLYCKGENSGG